METFTPLDSGENHEDTLSEVRQRIAYQDQLLQGILAPEIVSVTQAVHDQEDTLQQIYKPMITGIQASIGQQDLLLDQLQDAMKSDLRTDIGTQAAMLQTLVGPGGFNPDAILPDGEPTSFGLTDPSIGPNPFNPPSPPSQGENFFRAYGNYETCVAASYASFNPWPSEPWIQISGDTTDAQSLVPIIIAWQKDCQVSKLPPPPPQPPIGQPPQPPTIPPPVVGGCDPPPEVQLSCITVPKEWLYRFWIKITCKQDCSAEACIISAAGTPTVVPPQLLFGPYSTQPTPELLRELVREHCNGLLFPPSEPPSPPPPVENPPVGPPVSPPEVSPPGEPVQTDPTYPTADLSQIQRIVTPCHMDFYKPHVLSGIDQLIASAKDVAGVVMAGGATLVSAWTAQNYPLKSVLTKVPFVGPALDGAITAIIIKTGVRGFALLFQAFEKVRGQDDVALLGLYFLKSIVTFLENVSIGWELGPQILAQWQLELPQAKQILNYAISYVCPVTVPSQSEIASLYLTDQITERHALNLLKLNGMPDSWTPKTLYANRQRLTEDLMVRHWMRRRYPEVILDQNFRKYGWLEPKESQVVKEMYKFLPPPSDLIQFAVKDVFLPTKLGRKEMTEEYYQQEGLAEFFASQGIGELEITDAKGRNWKSDMGLNYWLAHYSLPSPGQSFDMLHRLRPNRVDLFRFADHTGKVTTPSPVLIDDVRRLLKEDDYNPIWRDRLTAISYRVLPRVDIRRLYRVGSFGPPLYTKGFRRDGEVVSEATGQAEKEVYEQYRDLGYNQADALRLAYFSATDAEEKAETKENAAVKTSVCKAYSSGIISKEQATAEIEKVVKDRRRAEIITGLCDFNARHKLVSAATAAIRKLYLRGLANRVQADARLKQIGILEFRRMDLLDLWQLELEGRSREATASQMCSWLGMGLITKPEIVLRLSRMQYSEEDIARIIRFCDLGIEAKARAERERKLKAEAARIAKLEALVEKARKQQEQLAALVKSKALSAYTDTNIRKWFYGGLLTEKELLNVLIAKGWDQEAIDDYLITLKKGPEGDAKEPESPNP